MLSGQGLVKSTGRPSVRPLLNTRIRKPSMTSVVTRPMSGSLSSFMSASQCKDRSRGGRYRNGGALESATGRYQCEVHGSMPSAHVNSYSPDWTGILLNRGGQRSASGIMPADIVHSTAALQSPNRADAFQTSDPRKFRN